MFKLLSKPISNYKAKKNIHLKVHTYFLSLAHSDLSGYNVCPMANKLTENEQNKNKSNCSFTCVGYRGGAQMFPKVMESRIKKTKMFFEDRKTFLQLLVKDIQKAIKSSIKQGFTPTFRLNAYSDIRWENYKIQDNKNIFELFPNIEFYDYTKLTNRKTPKNYSLTYSHFGKWSQTDKAIKSGQNVAMVFNTKVKNDLPSTYNNLSVIDGDKTDLRTAKNDGSNVIVGLRFKGSKKDLDSHLDNFVIDTK